MPRVKHVKKARKAIPEAGIAVGDSYYWWKFRYGGKRVSKTPPRQSQLTQSDKKSRMYQALESLEDLDNAPDEFENEAEFNTWKDEAISVLTSAAEQANEVAEEYEESASNKEEYFPGTGDELQEKADQCRSFADECESAVSELESAEWDKDSEDDEPGGINGSELQAHIDDAMSSFEI